MNVSITCYYHCLRVDHQNDVQINDLVKDTFIGSCQTYGTRKLKKRLEGL